LNFDTISLNHKQNKTLRPKDAVEMSGLINKSADFSEFLRIIHAGRARAFQAVNVALLETYWAVGEHLSRKVAEAGWGKGIVKELANWLAAQAPDVKGFSAQNLWRMKQFYEVFSSDEKLSALPRVLSWTHYCTELKTGRFEPEHMRKLSFYLEALDRDRKRPHENPSIGVLLCRTKDDEVVEYALSRHLSPALVAQYETHLIPRELLRQKLHEWSELLEAPRPPNGGEA
jgi:hypothetical protein